MQIKLRTLEELLQSWHPGLYIEETDHPDIDRVMLSEGRGRQKYICAIPKGGKTRSWLSMLSERREGSEQMTSDGTKHRSLDGLVKTLVKKRVIDWSAYKGFFGGNKNILK